MPYKILKGFFLQNGFEGVVDTIVDDGEFTKKEIVSLTKDGSIEKVKSSGAKTSKKVKLSKKKK